MRDTFVRKQNQPLLLLKCVNYWILISNDNNSFYNIKIIDQGDSGGPVLRKNYLLGISVSKVFGPVLNGTDGGNSWDRHRLNVHHAVDFYRDFITDVMKHL